MSYQIIWNNSEQEGISDVSVYVFKDNYGTSVYLVSSIFNL